MTDQQEKVSSNDNQISSTTDDDFVKVNGDEGQRGDENLTGCNGGAGKCVLLSCCNVPSQVCDLVLWKDIKKTGAVFGALFTLLLSFILFTLVSVFSYLGIATLLVTISFRIYKSVLSAIQKTNENNPFSSFLQADIQIKPEHARRIGEHMVSHVNCVVSEVRRLFLVEDLVDSLKVLVLLWIGTYVGSWFNTLTLLMLGLVSMFTLPMVYSTYKVQIDTYVGLVHEHVSNVKAIIVSKIPMLKKEKTQ